jgi:hypothetical protein
MYHLAQLNIASMTMPYDDPRMADFIDGLEPVNQLADSSSGFVWRMVTEQSTEQALFDFEAQGWLVNMSVWESLEALKAFISEHLHLSIMRRRTEWFAKMDEATMVLWWVPKGHIPSFKEAMQQLEHLRTHGPDPKAFGFSKSFEKPGQEKAGG